MTPLSELKRQREVEGEGMGNDDCEGLLAHLLPHPKGLNDTDICLQTLLKAHLSQGSAVGDLRRVRSHHRS